MLFADLHGLTETEAILEIDAILLSLKTGLEDEAIIVTGKGGVLRPLAIDMIQDEGFDWSYDDPNTGTIIVYAD